MRVRPERRLPAVLSALDGEAPRGRRGANGRDCCFPRPWRALRRAASPITLAVLLALGCHRDAKGDLELAERLLALGQPKRAIVAYQSALKVEPSARAHRGLGLAYEALSAHARAEQHLAAAVEARPDDIEARVALARVWTHFGRYERARQELSAALELEPHSEAALAFYGIYAESRADVERARALIESARARDEAESRTPSRALELVLADLRERGNDVEAAKVLREDVRYAPVEDVKLTLELARASQGRDNFQLSRQLLSPLVEREPGELDAWQLLAAAHIELGSYRAAREALQHLRARAREPEVRLLEARLGLASGMEIAPTLELRELLAALPPEQEQQRARLRRFLAQALAAQRKTDEAQRELETLVRERPDDGEGRLALAELLLSRGDSDEAAAVLSNLTDQHGQLAKAYHLLGRAELGRAKLAAAEAAFRKLREIAPRDASALYHLAITLLRQGRTEDAQRSLETNLESFPDHVESVRALADVLREAHGHAAARSFLSRHAKQHPDSASVAYAEGKWLLEHDEAEGGLAAYRRALAIDPAHHAAALELATFYGRHGKTAMAHGVLDTALDHDSENVALFLLAARLASDAGSYREAREYCERALESHPNHPLVLARLAAVHAEGFRDLPRAAQVLTAARGGAPEHPEVLDAMGWVERLRGDPARALPYLERANVADPDNPRILYHLGAALLGAGQAEAAREKLTRVLGLDPAFPTAKQIRSLLGAQP